MGGWAQWSTWKVLHILTYFLSYLFFLRHNLGFVSYILINNPFNDALMYFKGDLERCGLIAFYILFKASLLGSDEKLYISREYWFKNLELKSLTKSHLNILNKEKKNNWMDPSIIHTSYQISIIIFSERKWKNKKKLLILKL